MQKGEYCFFKKKKTPWP